MRLYIMLMLSIIVGLCSIWAGAETVTASTPVSLDTPFDLELGQQAVLHNHSTNITFDKIIEDSRCPATAECITAGSVRVQVSVDGQAYTLTLGDLMPGESTSVLLSNGLTLELLEVSPYPASQDDTPDAVDTIYLLIHNS